MEHKCENCGSPAKQIPANATWGTQVVSKTSGKKYFVFLKCETCNWSLSSDPKPRTWAKKPPKQANSANNNDKFREELMGVLHEIQSFQLSMDSKIDEIVSELRTK